MKDLIQIRMATIEDTDRLLEIYAPYCKETVITFEYEVPSKEEFKERIQNILKKYPYLVAELDGKIVGYAYVTPYKSRAAYQWCVETSIYVDMACHAHGIGSLLYTKLIEILKMQRIRNVYACVTLPNEKSEALHKKFGFVLIGRFPGAGYKADGWHDIGWFEKHLDYGTDVPEPVIGIDKISFEDILQS